MILIKGNYGNGNLGDDLLAENIYFKLLESKKEVLVLYNKFEDAPKKINTRSFPVTPKNKLAKFLTIIKLAIERKTIVYGGGSQIQLTKGIFNILLSARILKFFGSKVMFFSIGIEQIQCNRKNLNILKKIVSLSDYFSVRDTSSYKLLEGLGLKKDYYLSSDPVLALRNSSQNQNYELSKNGEKRILIVPMDYPVLYSFVDGLISSFENDNKAKILIFEIIPFARVDNYAVNKLYNYISLKSNSQIVVLKYDFTYDFCNVRYQFERANLIISGRLHGGIVSSVFNKPLVYCASFDRNIKHNKNLAVDIGFSENCIVSDVENSFDKAIEFYNNPNSYIRDEAKFNISLDRLSKSYSQMLETLGE